ncbi:MAG: radical SAM protein [Myxococcales bacterium]|nr:radical SAM protein [Myxococcales bacterium]
MKRGDEHLALLEAAADAGVMPLRSPCPAGCKFCYEYHMHKIFPAVKLAKIPTYDDASFDHYMDELQHAGQIAFPVSPVYFDDGTVHYSSMSDPFVQGLSDDQIMRLAGNNDARGKRLYLSTPGNFLEPALAKRLTEAYPDTFRLGLSAMSFDEEMRPRLFKRYVSGAKLAELVSVLRAPRLYMLNLGFERTLADLEVIRGAVAKSGERASVIITYLHYNQLHGQDMADLAKEACDFSELAAYLVKHRERYESFADIFLHSPPDAYVFRFRNMLRALLRRYEARAGDVIFTSRGAAPMMRALVVDEGIDVVDVSDSLGGTTSFTTSLTSTNIIAAIEAMLRERRADRPLGRILLPSSIWWINRTHSLDGCSFEDVRGAFPDLRFELIDIPMEMRRYRLTIDDGHAYHNLDVQRTRALRRQRDAETLAALGACLDEGESLTDANFIRRVGDQLASGSQQVTYFEVLVERSDELPATVGERRAVTIAGEPRTVVRTQAYAARLNGSAQRELYQQLFVERTPAATLRARGPEVAAEVDKLLRRFAGVERAAVASA